MFEKLEILGGIVGPASPLAAAGTPATRPRHARDTPDAQPRGKQPEDERPRGSVAPRIGASEPACVLGMQRFLRGKQHSRARSLFELFQLFELSCI